MARAGVLIDHLEIEDPTGKMMAATGHGLGCEAGPGLALGTGLSLTPGLRYRSPSRHVEIATTTTTVDLRYVAFEVEIARLS